jgi:hypothetical protein
MKHWAVILGMWMPCILLGQKLPPQETAFLLGWSKKIDGFHVPTIGFERSFKRWSSFQMGLGLNAFASPRHPDFTKLNTQFSAEVRYYMMLRHGRRLTGIYMGIYADMNRTRLYFREGGGIAFRKSWEDAGPSLGYQHAIGPHVRFNEGFAAVIQSNIRDNTYLRRGADPKVYTIYDAWYTYYFYVKMAIVW